MDLLELTKTLVKAIVKNEEKIVVEEKKVSDDYLEIIVKVNKDDIGRVIGKSGKTINSLRTILQEASFLRDNKYIKLEIEKF